MARLRSKPSHGSSEVGARIVKLLDERGWTQRDLAARAGVSQSVVSQLVRGATQNGRVDTLEKIARVCDVTLAWLATGSEAPTEAADIYPNRARAVAAARLLGEDETDIAEATSIHGFKSDTEPSPAGWYAIIARARERRLGATPPRVGVPLTAEPPPRAAKLPRGKA